MTPIDPTRTVPPNDTSDPSDAALDAGLAAAFGIPDTKSYQSAEPEVGAILAGKYRLSERIGEGGMGSVWVAHQTEPVKRKVAVKLVKAGMDSKAVLARFEAERQALAVMDHPNIAKVLDGGVHDGRPYFVMELVKGVPITDYCDARKLTPAQRLELFVPVCQAIQHAHQKGIIHRDIKPSNVLVALYDDKPVPKVIDFGIAKATGGALTDKTFETAFGGVVGTPQYMSPEQASLNNLDIDTRSDVYSLGVLLYELLTGSPPFAPKELEKRGLLEILRVVREEEPPRPSVKLSTADTLPSLAAVRSTEPKKLAGMLRSELDWIVMKALCKERDRRYETANGFARDIDRYLNHEPVQAGPPSASYRFKKFVRRNRGQVVAAGLVLLALVAGVLGTTIGLVRAQRSAEQERHARVREAERAEGEKQAKEEAEAKRKEAETNLTFATRGNEILGSVFKGLNPKANYSTVAELRNVLKTNLIQAAKHLDDGSIGAPQVVAGMQTQLGGALLGLGEYEQATQLYTKALNTARTTLGADHPDTLSTMGNLATAYVYAGKMDQALPLMVEMVKYEEARRGAGHPDTLTSKNNLAIAYLADGKPDMALPLMEETFPLMKAEFGTDHASTLTCVNNLASIYRVAGKNDRAIALLEEALPLMKARFGSEHPDTLACVNNLAVSYRDSGKLELATPLLEESLKLHRALLGHDHPDTLISMANLAAGYWSLQRLDRSVPLFEEVVSLREKKLGRKHYATQLAVANLGTNYKDAGRVEEALPLLEEVHRSSKALPAVRIFSLALLELYAETGKSAEGAKLLDELLADARKTLPKDSPHLAGQLAQFGLTLLQMKRYTEAEPLLRECLAIRVKTQPDAWTTFNTHSLLGGALLGQKKYADAEPLLLKGYEGMKSREKTIPTEGNTRIHAALDRLVELYTATGKPDGAAKYQKLRAAYHEVLPPPRASK